MSAGAHVGRAAATAPSALSALASSLGSEQQVASGPVEPGTGQALARILTCNWATTRRRTDALSLGSSDCAGVDGGGALTTTPDSPAAEVVPT